MHLLRTAVPATCLLKSNLGRILRHGEFALEEDAARPGVGDGAAHCLVSRIVRADFVPHEGGIFFEGEDTLITKKTNEQAMTFMKRAKGEERNDRTNKSIAKRRSRQVSYALSALHGLACCQPPVN